MTTQTSQHTPAPWESERQTHPEGERREIHWIVSVAPNGQRQSLATCNYRPGSTEANARLIAASPLMAAYIAKHASSGDTEAIEILREAGIATKENTADRLNG